MRVNENGQYVSDDGFWVWDGAAWIPADGSATPAAAEAVVAETATVAEPAAEAAVQATAYQPEATQEYVAVDFASDTTAHDTPVSVDEPGTLAAGDQVVPRVDNAHPMSPDGRHWWDGEKWIDVSTDATSLHMAGLAQDTPAATADTGWQSAEPEVAETPVVIAESFSEPEPDPAPVAAAQPERQLSPDGMWEWNGTQWVPADQQAAPEPEPEPAKVERQLSPDGHWEWDGTAWVPAQQEAVAAVPAGAHVSPDGHWWWDGSQWLPTGR
jgi:hypothetical protein